MEDHTITADQIPTNPLDMPPPYWRGSGAIFQILDSLSEIIPLLTRLLPELDGTHVQLDGYYKQHPDGMAEDDDADLDEFGGICAALWELEHRIKLRAESAILMSAIQAEDDLNRFCVFNLHKDIAESIEGLAPWEKLLVASAVSRCASAKGSAVFEATKKLCAWRNAYAHGHCVDRPTRSLRHNHLISPPQYPAVPDTIAEMKELVTCYLRISKYLASISINPYTSAESFEDGQIRDRLKEISRFHFEVSKESNQIYTVDHK